jgi:rRNA processing protein Gar1
MPSMQSISQTSANTQRSDLEPIAVEHAEVVDADEEAVVALVQVFDHVADPYSVVETYKRIKNIHITNSIKTSVY